MKKLIATLILFLALSTGAKAATIIDFEDADPLNNGYAPLTYYKNAVWSNFSAIDAIIYDDSFQYAISTPNYVAYNADTLSSSTIQFNNSNHADLLEITFAATATPDVFVPYDIKIEWNKYSTVKKAWSSGTDYVHLTYTSNIPDPVIWRPTDGSVSGGINGLKFIKFTTVTTDGRPYNEFFGMDNLTFREPVPEPTSMVLGLISLAGLAGARRKRQAN